MAAARMLLGMSQRDLARLSGISCGALQRLESGRVSSRLATYDAVVRALAEHGIRFLEATGTVAGGIYLLQSSEAVRPVWGDG